MIDLDELEAKAKAATPGPWYADEHLDTELLCNEVGETIPGWQFYNADNWPLGAIWSDMGPEITAAPNVAFIAAANPTAVLALIVRIRDLEDRLSTKTWHDRLNEPMTR